MTDRDVGRFGRWAPTYDEDWLQPRFFGPVQEATLRRAALLTPHPRRVLDVGCGTGTLLRQAADRFPDAELVGVDPARGMVDVANTAAWGDRPPRFAQAAAEHLPFADEAFDLVVSTVSFHHWRDQPTGLREIGRILAPGGCLILADIMAISVLRAGLSLFRKRGRFHTPSEIAGMLRAAGLTPGGTGTVCTVAGVPAVTAVWARRGIADPQGTEQHPYLPCR